MIFLDPRFGSKVKGQKASHDVRPLFEKLGIEYTEQSLPEGDFWFVGNGPDGAIKVGVELKTVPDLVSSMQSGRLGDQISKMLDPQTRPYDRVYLIVEGPYRASRKNGLLEVPRGRRYAPLFNGGSRRPTYWVDVKRFLCGLGEAGVRVIETRTQFETVQMLSRVLDAYWSKPYSEHDSLGGLYQPPIFTIRRESEARRRMRLAAKVLSGVGDDRTQAVADAFGSIANMARGTVGEWEQIEGIGKTIAKRAYAEIREDCRCQDGDSTSMKPRRTTSGRSSAK